MRVTAVSITVRYEVTLIALCNQDNGAYDSLRKSVVELVTGDR